jgi:hypothetical protein
VEVAGVVVDDVVVTSVVVEVAGDKACAAIAITTFYTGKGSGFETDFTVFNQLNCC